MFSYYLVATAGALLVAGLLTDTSDRSTLIGELVEEISQDQQLVEKIYTLMNTHRITKLNKDILISPMNLEIKLGNHEENFGWMYPSDSSFKNGVINCVIYVNRDGSKHNNPFISIKKQLLNTIIHELTHVIQVINNEEATEPEAYYVAAKFVSKYGNLYV